MSMDGIIFGKNNYLYSIKGIAAKRAFFGKMTIDEIHQLMDFKRDVLLEWQSKQDSFRKDSREYKIASRYKTMVYLDCCCCFVAIAEKFGLKEKDFSPKQKASWTFRTWDQIEDQIQKRRLYPSAESARFLPDDESSSSGSSF